MKLVLLLCTTLFASVAFADTEAGPWRGPHTLNRVMVPSDSDQKANYFLPVKGTKKPKINAPLVSTESVQDPVKKFKYLKLFEQTDLSSGAGQQK